MPIQCSRIIFCRLLFHIKIQYSLKGEQKNIGSDHIKNSWCVQQLVFLSDFAFVNRRLFGKIYYVMYIDCVSVVYMKAPVAGHTELRGVALLSV